MLLYFLAKFYVVQAIWNYYVELPVIKPFIVEVLNYFIRVSYKISYHSDYTYLQSTFFSNSQKFFFTRIFKPSMLSAPHLAIPKNALILKNYIQIVFHKKIKNRTLKPYTAKHKANTYIHVCMYIYIEIKIGRKGSDACVFVRVNKQIRRNILKDHLNQYLRNFYYLTFSFIT